MKKAFKYIFLSALAVLSTLFLSAQGLPLAPSDPSVRNGVLPNGMTYYLVANPTTSGTADFALVQRTGTADLGSKAVDIARDALTSLPRFQESPQSFLSAHSVAPGKDGYVKVSEHATLYHFDNVILAQESVDSVLLVMMGIADKGTNSDDPTWSLYTPADHAVIVSGDINVDQMVTKLKMLSYMTPYRSPLERQEKEWQNSEAPIYEVHSDATGQYATVSVSWAFPRAPKEYMNTLQPAIYSMFVNELGLLAQERISQQLKSEDLPVVSVSYDYVNSQRSYDAERLSISVTLASEHLCKAVEVVAMTMSSLDQKTAAPHEFLMAKREYFSALEKEARKVMKSNSDYVAQCTSAFLYNSSVSPAKDIYEFLRYRDLDVLTELGYFNNISSALLDGNRNLRVSCRTTEDARITETELGNIFQNAWNSEASAFLCAEMPDSLQPLAPLEPIKLKSTKHEPISGGLMWTFANGVRVIYKKQDTGRKMYFALALNGGYGNIRGLSNGEGAFVSDYLGLSKVGDLDGMSFRGVLEKNGIVLNPVMNLSNTIISGSGPEAEVDMILNALSSFVNERGYDSEAFEYYKSCQQVSAEFAKGSVQNRRVAIDSLLWPDYGYSEFKIYGNLSEEFPSKVEAFWQHMQGKVNDGVLILIGNVDEVKLRKHLQSYVGNYSTADRVYPRLNIKYHPVSGTTAYTFKGDKNSVDVVMTARLPFSAENYMAAQIATAVLEKKLSKELTGTGMYLRLNHDCRIYPHERLNVAITLEEADLQGFAHDEKIADASETVALVRKLLASLSDVEVTDEEILKYKEVLKGHLARKMQDPQYWVHAIAMRHLDGKDLTTSYESRIDDVTAEKVKFILSALSSTGRVEYIIEK